MAQERNDDQGLALRRESTDDPAADALGKSHDARPAPRGPFDLRDIVAIATIASTKRCTRCNQEKPLGEFHKRRHYVRAGVRSACKACTSTIHTSTRSARLDEGVAQPRSPASRAERAHDPDFRQKNRVRMRTRRAIAAGLLVPGPCAECGDKDVQAHHESYEGPRAHLQVTWLCREHHSRAHGRRNWTRQLALLL